MRRKSAGFTLQEAMLTVVIVGILATVTPTMLKGISNVYLTSAARNDIQRDARASLDILNRMLRQAQDGTLVVDNGSGSGAGPMSRIRFTLADGRYCEFHQSGSDLVEVLGNTTSVLSRNLKYIAFSFPRTDDPSLISVSMTMSKAVQLGGVDVLELTIQDVRIMD